MRPAANCSIYVGVGTGGAAVADATTMTEASDFPIVNIDLVMNLNNNNYMIDEPNV